MEYRIKKIKDTTQDYKGLEGVELLVFISYVNGKSYIDGPINKKDLNKYYEWLRKGCYEVGITYSDNLEDFKVEFIIDPGQYIPFIENEAFEDLGLATKDDMENYNIAFEEYFEEARQISEED